MEDTRAHQWIIQWVDNDEDDNADDLRGRVACLPIFMVPEVPASIPDWVDVKKSNFCTSPRMWEDFF